MVREVTFTRFEASDASLHGTRAQAIAHDAKLEIQDLFLNDSTFGKLSVKQALDVVLDHDSQIHHLLCKIMEVKDDNQTEA